MRAKLPQAFWLIQWHLLFAGLAVIAMVVWVLAQALPFFNGSFIMLLFFAAAVGVFAIIFLLHQLVNILTLNQQYFEKLNDTLAASKELLEQATRDIKLSETVKSIVYRDMNYQYLRTAVMEKLHQQDFKATYAMIEDIARRAEYKTLAEELKMIADNYQDATEQGRTSQIEKYIDELLGQYQWASANIQIETFIKQYSDLDKAKALKQKLTEKKEQRKRRLLADWDEAVKREDTDGSIMVLKELDLYLTPSEGLALQEAASEVFKNKLHNLGVRFSLAVSEKQWADALAAGQEIIKGFPNSRMADEIRGKLSTLSELAEK
jgi:ABC-type multidrug transport system fused ATPase/permease subunit